MYWPKRVKTTPVRHVAHGVPDGILEDIVNLADEHLKRPTLLLLSDYHSSRLPARISANAIGTKSIAMKRVMVQSEERPRFMGL